MKTRTSPLRLLAADDKGATWDVRGWTPAARSGNELVAAPDAEWIPLPSGSRVQFLEGRLPMGWPKGSEPGDEPLPLEGALAVAAQLPSGFTRTLLPAYQRDPQRGAPFLPFFGYTAVAFRDGQPWVAAVQTDDNPHWAPEHYGGADMQAALQATLAEKPDNRVLDQLRVCALEYGCYNAQNIFLGRWEGAVPVSPACNARCVGCISEQPDDRPASPQVRFRFVPRLEEVLELGRAHLKGEDSIFSFGQGCEGEPLLQARLIADSVRALRAETSVGTLHLNTNGSLPEGFARVVEAGLDSVRISLNSVLPEQYTAYYQPLNYTFDDLLKSIRKARDHGVLVSLNYLHMPGWNDREAEVDALESLVRELGICQIQMRTLNIDPDLYTQTVPLPAGRALGIRSLIERLRPYTRIGNHTLPRHRFG